MRFHIRQRTTHFTYDRYDYRFKAVTYSYKFFPDIINIYNPGYYLEVSKEIKQNSTGLGNSENCLCVIFDCYYQKFISRRKTWH